MILSLAAFGISLIDLMLGLRNSAQAHTISVSYAVRCVNRMRSRGVSWFGSKHIKSSRELHRERKALRAVFFPSPCGLG